MRRLLIALLVVLMLLPSSVLAQTDTDDPDFYIGQLEAWLSAEIGGGDVLRTGMADPQFTNAEWYINHSTAVGTILAINNLVQAQQGPESKPTNDLDDVRFVIQALSTDHANAAAICDTALVNNDDDKASECQQKIETTTANLRQISQTLRDWRGEVFDFTPEPVQGRPSRAEATETAQAEPSPSRRATSTPTEEPTATPDESAETPFGETLSTEWFDIRVDSSIVTTIPSNSVIVTLVVVNTDDEPHEFGWTTGNFALEVGSGPAATFNLLSTANVRSGTDEWAGEFSPGNEYLVSQVFNFDAVDPYADVQQPEDLVLVWTPQEGPIGTFRLEVDDTSYLTRD